MTFFFNQTRTQNYDDYCMCHGGCNASIYELNGTGERSRLRRRRILKCCFAVLTRFFWRPSFGDDATHHLVSRLPYYGRPDNDPTRPDDESSAWRQEITPLTSLLYSYYHPPPYYSSDVLRRDERARDTTTSQSGHSLLSYLNHQSVDAQLQFLSKVALAPSSSSSHEKGLQWRWPITHFELLR